MNRERIDMESALLGARFCDGGHHVNCGDSEPIRLPSPIEPTDSSSLGLVCVQLLPALLVVLCGVAAVAAFIQI